MIAQRIEAYHLRTFDVTAGQARRCSPSRVSGVLSCMKTGLFRGRYEIRAGERCVGVLQLSGLFRPTVRATTDDGVWYFEPAENSIVVRSQNPLCELATVDLSFSDHGGIVRFPDGRAYVFTSDFWKGRAEFQTPSGDPVVRFRFRGLFRPRAQIEILEKGRQMPELPWFTMLGWSLIVGYL